MVANLVCGKEESPENMRDVVLKTETEEDRNRELNKSVKTKNVCFYDSFTLVAKTFITQFLR